MLNMKLKKLLLLPSIFLILALSACASTASSESTGQYIDSSAVTTQVKAALLTQKGLDSMDINVTTYKDIVQLSGFVPSANQVNLATQTAESVNGVKKVINNLVVRPNTN